MANNDRNPTDQDLDTAGLDNTPGTGSRFDAAQSMSGAGGDVSGMSSPDAGGRDWSKSEGQAGSDYLHGADGSDGPSRHGGMSSSPGGTSGSGPGTGAGADLEETHRLAREATERLREDFDNRGVSGNGNF
ncbi:MAG: hypothetical protein KY444_09220 [Gemmatimonadetes bacterium]|nr:hypothetical protein [Gemmatimonadota bacterium]